MPPDIEVKHLATEDFPDQIQAIVVKKSKNGNSISLIEAILIWCEEHMLEPHVAGEIVRKFPNLQELVKVEAEDLNLLKEKSARITL